MGLNEKIKQEIAEWEWLSCRNKTRVTRGIPISFDVDTLHSIILGGMARNSFPVFWDYKPQETEAENQVEFAPVATFFDLLAADREYIDRLTAKVAEIHSLQIESNV